MPGGKHCVIVFDVDQEDSDPVFSAAADRDGDRVTVRVTGEVDMATAAAMREAVLRERAPETVLDLRGVTFFDSAAIHALVRLVEDVPAGFSVLASRQVRRVLAISGLDGQPWLAEEPPAG